MKLRLLSSTLALLLPMAATTQATQPSVSIVVGSFSTQEGGTDGLASPLHSPFGVDFDRQGNMFIVELEGGRVHRLDTQKQLRQIAGDGSQNYSGDGGPAAMATFHGMHNVAITPSNDIYIADSWNHCIRKIDATTGVISTIAGTGEAGYHGDDGPARDALFDFVMCITWTAQSNELLVADLRNRRIRAVDLNNGTVRTIAGNGQTGVPVDGNLATQSPLVDPRAVAADSQGRVYILERNGHALRVVTTDGKIKTVAGTGTQGYHDGPALHAQLNSPKHLCVDDDDNVIIADDQNRAIRMYDATNQTVTTVLGRGIGEPAVQLSRPHGVCYENGKLYVVDTGNNRILSIDWNSKAASVGKTHDLERKFKN